MKYPLSRWRQSGNYPDFLREQSPRNKQWLYEDAEKTWGMVGNRPIHHTQRKGKQAWSLPAKGWLESWDPSAFVWGSSTSLTKGLSCAPLQPLPTACLIWLSPLPTPSPKFAQICRMLATDHNSCFPTITVGTVESVTAEPISPPLKAEAIFPTILTCAVFHFLTSLESGHVWQLILSLSGHWYNFKHNRTPYLKTTAYIGRTLDHER